MKALLDFSSAACYNINEFVLNQVRCKYFFKRLREIPVLVVKNRAIMIRKVYIYEV